ncbi:MAG: preprotein translocase subunit YajC [Clostridia bacterium]|nr:preprotein translocase subunit YajC [Clostridia bacterium]
MFYMLLDAAADTTTKNGTGNLIMTIGMIVLLLLFFYFGIIRPGKKQEKEAKNLRDNLTVGDEITTIGGIIGKVVYIKDETCIIETGREHTRIRILKSAVRSVDVHAEDAE